MPDLEKVLRGLDCCVNMLDCHDCCPYHPADKCEKHQLIKDAFCLLKAQEATINELYTLYEGLCKEIREKYESDDVCGLCQYDGAFVGESGDWMNECPGFETNDCFCMKNSIRKMCGKPLIEEP